MYIPYSLCEKKNVKKLLKQNKSDIKTQETFFAISIRTGQAMIRERNFRMRAKLVFRVLI